MTADHLPNWYEASLPTRERKTRGHFSTPPPLVEDILDACGYTPEQDLSQLRWTVDYADDFKVVEAVYDDLVGFWTQSHQVRMLGALLTDVAGLVQQRGGIERSLNIKSGTTTMVVSSRTIEP